MGGRSLLMPTSGKTTCRIGLLQRRHSPQLQAARARAPTVTEKANTGADRVLGPAELGELVNRKDARTGRTAEPAEPAEPAGPAASVGPAETAASVGPADPAASAASAEPLNRLTRQHRQNRRT